MNEAELEIRLSQLMYPSIHYARERCLESMMTTSNFIWHDGRLFVQYQDKAREAMHNLLLSGEAPSPDEALWKYNLDHGRKSVVERTSTFDGDKNAEEMAKSYHQMSLELAAQPVTYRLSGFSLNRSQGYVGAPISCIPDNAKTEWMALVVEFLNNVLASKIDFDERSILTHSDQEIHFGKTGQLTEKEKESRAALSESLGQILAEAEGKPWPPTNEQREKDRKNWEEHYSPAARARRANAENIESRRIAAIILEDLKHRGLVKA